MALFFDDYRLESPLEYMANSLVPPIEGLSVNAVQMPHPHGKIAVRCLDQEMIVVVHEAISMADPVEAINHAFKQQQKGLPVSGIGKYIGSRVATGHDILRLGILYGEGVPCAYYNTKKLYFKT